MPECVVDADSLRAAKIEVSPLVPHTNLTSAFMLSQAAHPELKRAGGGKIVNIGSMASYMGGPTWTAYNIQVNTIWPGLIDTCRVLQYSL